MMLIFGISVVAQPNPVASALSLVVSFVALAALYVSLDAFFIGIIQILVYAGAVMVLFLFIIMLLDLRSWAASQGSSRIRSPWRAACLIALALRRAAQDRAAPFQGGRRDLRPRCPRPCRMCRALGICSSPATTCPSRSRPRWCLVATDWCGCPQQARIAITVFPS